MVTVMVTTDISLAPEESIAVTVTVYVVGGESKSKVALVII